MTGGDHPDGPEAATERRLCVAEMPGAHPFGRRLTELVTDLDVDLVADREIDDLTGVDVVHVHFGYDYLDPQRAPQVVEKMADEAVPLVLTVHDIVYPSDDDALPHRAHTGTLVAAADAVVTLTPAAAQEIWARWGVESTVIPHPRLLGEEEVAAATRSAQAVRGGRVQPVVGVLLERMGENIEGPQILDAVAAVASGRPGAELRLVVEEAAWRSECGSDGGAILEGVAGLEEWASVELVRYQARDWHSVHREVAALDAFVVPLRFGTHSSWLELCRDLGVVPVFPQVGCLREQWFGRVDEDDVAGVLYDRRDLSTLAPAVREALDQVLPMPARAEDGSTVGALMAYTALYREVCRR